ncbi:MAG TPA: gamma-glutamyl-gamma-aminobutyrate hydrolase family protein, partial [Pseudobdellovibrionaceae bacterium]|nr:gamma-glutamyl-gamma-aminobutyrate hydrolase family protein [Pseudobdellovibrionaceae bacterium]
GCELQKGSKAEQIYKASRIRERHRHRYEFNNKFKALFEKKGMAATGVCKERDLVEIIELPDHPWFVGVQFHPEFKSKPLSPHPLFTHFVKASLLRKKLIESVTAPRKTLKTAHQETLKKEARA